MGRLLSSWQKIGTNVNSYTYYSYDEKGRAYKSDFCLMGMAGGTLSQTYTYTYNDDDGSLTNINVKNGSNSENISFTYDALKRPSGKTVAAPNASLSYSYVYKTLSGNRSSNLVSNYTAYINSVAVRTYGYTYDKLSNITAITSGGTTESVYTYDAQGQLLSETIASQNLKYVYTYDNYGNIQTVTKKNLSTNATIETYTYTYDTAWKDQLKTYTIKDSSGKTITSGTFTYDNIGNPTNYFNGSAYEFTWKNGRELATSKKNGITTTYKYGADGLRISKSGYEFFYSDGLLVRQIWADGEVLDFLYDESGTPYSFIYNTYQYYYVKNMQGDVVAIVDEYGDTAAEYTYDAWGNVIDITEYFMEEIGAANPIRYRSYYYDTETSFYYLQTRYYDPAIRRFINADGYVNANGDILGFNMYAYCGNNPVMYSDPTGSVAIVDDAIILGTLFTIAIFSYMIAPLLYEAIDSAVQATSDAITNIVDEIEEKVGEKEEEKVQIQSQTAAVYYGADTRGKVWKIVTGPMDLDTAVKWVNDTAANGTYGRNASWGVYTDTAVDALILGARLGNVNPIDDGKTNEYHHYHMENHMFGRYKHFHLWFGRII